MKEFVGTRCRKNQKIPNPADGPFLQPEDPGGKERRKEKGFRNQDRRSPGEDGQVGIDVQVVGHHETRQEIPDPVDLREQVGRRAPDAEARLEQPPVSGVGEEENRKEQEKPPVNRLGAKRLLPSVPLPPDRFAKDQGERKGDGHLLGGHREKEEDRRRQVQEKPAPPLPPPQVGEEASEVEERHQRDGTPADVRHRLRLRGVNGEQERGEKGDKPGGGRAADRRRKAEEHDGVRRVETDVHEVKAEQPQPRGPVQGVGELQKRPDPAGKAGEVRAPGVHAAVVDDDVVVVELENAVEGIQVDGDDGPGEEQDREKPLHGRPGEAPEPRVNAASSISSAFHHRSGAFSRMRRTRFPSRSATAARHFPARPVKPVFTPIAPR